MAPRKVLSFEPRAGIIALRNEGYNQCEISRKLGISRINVTSEDPLPPQSVNADIFERSFRRQFAAAEDGVQYDVR